MRRRRMALGLLLIGGLLGGCELKQEWPPAIPDERTVWQPPPAPPAPVVPPPSEVAHGVPVSEVPVVTPTPEELQPFVTKRPTRAANAKPEQVITAANTHSRLGPTTSGYADGHSSIQHYPYLPGRVYEIYSSPNSPTAIILPRGERLAAPPALNPEAWDVGVIEMGEGEQRQETVVVRPLASGQEATTHLFTQSGRAFFCRLRSFAQASMVAVTWDVPQRPTLSSLDGRSSPERPRRERSSVVGQGALFPPRSAPALAGGASQSPEFHAPLLDPARLHTAYRIEAVKGKPAWVPLAVYDDGSKTVIRFQEALTYTQAPGIFATDPDGHPSLVQFTPYTVPGEPEKGAYYIVQGLWPQLELKGEGGMVVRITRQTG